MCKGPVNSGKYGKEEEQKEGQSEWRGERERTGYEMRQENGQGRGQG